MKTAEMLPLPTLLSHTLVAFTIEFDNEFEHRMPHRTSNYGGTSASGPWLVSMAMWFNCMRFVGEEGVNAAELERLACTHTNLNGMRRWGYVAVGPGKLIRATPKGVQARAVWAPLFGEIERRWRERFAEREIARLRGSLAELIDRIGFELPDCMPILKYGLFSEAAARETRVLTTPETPLPALLAKALLAFAVEFERESHLSLAICANILRVLGEEGVRMRDLPALTGVSKEAIAMAMGILGKKNEAVVENRVVRLTEKGQHIRHAYQRLLHAIEDRWHRRFGKESILALSGLLAPIAAGTEGLEPYPDNWRASIPKPATLPHYPMVLHRGGFPDGS